MPKSNAHKLQSAMEYLMTYGWAILIIGVTLVALYELNIFTPSNYVTPICTMPSGFSCTNQFLYSNGLIILNIEYTDVNPIQVSQIGCNSNQTTANIHTYTSPISLNTGENDTFELTCYSGGSPFSGTLGSVFSGSIMINYTDTRTGFENMIYGKIIAKVAHS